ncbi:histidine kinase [Agrococcus sp. Marseille-Q4369]|uniref:sensor histidine kinase n=1 Tax=Agrococcus sp. Marseille-Q4369 TaxID=2810513 RepID=UPI001B8AD0B8|nr:histidine kinase [Agrococcus sp. Marseille-Q4369]QUW19396.1 sensor domain-containing protein [Agrococcus sp. Marseille-Q4369]
MQRLGPLLATIAHLVVLGSIGLPILTIILTFVALGAGLLVVVVGVLFLAVALLGMFAVAWFERERIAALYDAPVPPAVLRGSHRTDWLRVPHRLLRIVSDGAHWRAILSFALASLFGVFVLSLLPLVGLGIPLAFAPLGDAERVRIPLTSIAVPVEWAPLLGILALAAGIAGTIGLAIAHRGVALGLLVPDERAQLEAKALHERERRQGVVQAADYDRTRIERDLHDGVQPRLVSIAMQLGMARDRIESDPEGAKRLIDEAHASSKNAVTELRQVARGIHVAVLDDRGLDAAVSALAARSAIPVEVDARLERRCSRESETAVYFAIAEGITNAQKHARASRIRVSIRTREHALWARIEDDGIGGAERLPGGGIDGLANRVAGVGGTLTLSSPVGGPTAIEVDVPCAS